MKRVFLTGASSGIGLAVARALVARADEVWGTSRNPARVPKLPHLHAVRLDLSDPASIDQAFTTALSEAKQFDVMINNAGSGYFGPAEDLSSAETAREFQVLVFGHLHLLRLALNVMQAQGKGLIINVTSLASRLPVPFMATYNAAKAAMAAFTMSMQLELGDSQIHMVDLQPADICTEFNDVVRRSLQPNPRYEAQVAKTWAAVDRNMKAAPKPELVARHVLKLIDATNPSPRITVGDAFQSRIAPLIFRFLPQRIRLWGLRRYYGI
jgi:NAD(P)-dependent dehydrogenase (short-subunit alcohol dehydrogenase family)